MSDMIKALEWAKTLGYVPEEVPGCKPLINSEDFYDNIGSKLFEDDPEDFVYDVIEDALTVSIKRAYDGVIDYADQLYMPTVFGGVWPKFRFRLADEAQDLSALNHEMLRQLARTRPHCRRRSLAVHLCIPRELSLPGMGSLVRDFKMVEFTLSVTFRCSISVVRRAQDRVPHMKWAPWAVEGKVASLHRWDASVIPDGAAVICRNNAPLLAGLCPLEREAGIHIVGMDIGPSMVKTPSKLGDPTMPRVQLLKAIDKWEADRLAKGKNAGSISDKAGVPRSLRRRN